MVKFLRNYLNKKGLLMPSIYSYKTFKNNPFFFLKDIYSDIKKDVNWNKKCKTGHNLICFGLPKSGSTMIEQIYRDLGYIDLFNTSIRKCIYLSGDNHPHEIHEGFFKYLPNNKGNFLKTHSHFKKFYIDLLEEFNFSAFVLVRDIRDMMLSRYYHIINDPFHSEHIKIKNLDFNKGFMESLMTIKSGDSFSQLKYFNNWIVDWTNLNKYPIIKFEDFKKNKYQFIKKVVKFSLIKDFNETQIEQIIKNLSISSKKDVPISKKIKFFGKKKTTFRKGNIGDWKNYFSSDHIKHFKNVAQESLEVLNYEKNSNW